MCLMLGNWLRLKLLRWPQRVVVLTVDLSRGSFGPWHLGCFCSLNTTTEMMAGGRRACDTGSGNIRSVTRPQCTPRQLNP